MTQIGQAESGERRAQHLAREVKDKPTWLGAADQVRRPDFRFQIDCVSRRGELPCELVILAAIVSTLQVRMLSPAFLSNLRQCD
jgi:hypothetical protein